MENNYSPELKEFLASVEAALIQAGKNARQLSSQTGTTLVVREPAAGSATAGTQSGDAAPRAAASCQQRA